MIFEEKYFSSYILLTDKISLPDCFYFLRYWPICLLQLLVNQVDFKTKFDFCQIQEKNLSNLRAKRAFKVI